MKHNVQSIVTGREFTIEFPSELELEPAKVDSFLARLAGLAALVCILGLSACGAAIEHAPAKPERPYAAWECTPAELAKAGLDPSMRGAVCRDLTPAIEGECDVY